MLITITHYQRPRSAACNNVSPYRAFLSNNRWSFSGMMFVIMSISIRSNPMFESAWRTIWEENTTFSFTISVRRQCNLEIRSRSPKLIPVRYFLFEKSCRVGYTRKADVTRSPSVWISPRVFQVIGSMSKEHCHKKISGYYIAGEECLICFHRWICVL